MIDSIFLAMTGLQGHQRGLNVISNNVSNMNTAGFRRSIVSFADVFTGASPSEQSQGRRTAGRGLDASVTLLDMRPGDAQSTGRGLDTRLLGPGFFVVRDDRGEQRYTRDGAFDFDENGELVMSGTTRKVLTLNADGDLVPLMIDELRTNPFKATTQVSLRGQLSRENEGNDNDDDDVHTIEPVVVFDASGRAHTLRITLEVDTTLPPQPALARFVVKVFEDELEIGSGEIEAIGPRMEPPSLILTLALPGTDPAEIAFDFEGVNVVSNGDDSLEVEEQDGRPEGSITEETFDENGVLQLTYSNGQKAQGPRLILASIADEESLVQLGDSLFAYEGEQPVVLREANVDLQVVSGSLERSNVDLTQEFSELILMQRGYQASSQVVTTANEMMQDLLQMRGRR